MTDKLTLQEKIAYRFIFNEKRVYKNWYGRFFTFNIHYNRIARVLPKIKNWYQWCKVWVDEGKKLEEIAARQVELKNIQSAIELFHHAVGCYHIGQHFFFISPEQKETAQEMARRSYKKAIALYNKDERPIRLEIPYDDCKIPAYLHLTHKPNMPLVIQVNGMDNIKEAENHFFGQGLLKHGFNFLAFDGLGQGEMWKQKKFDSTEYPKLFNTVIDWLETNNNYSINIKKIGLLGFSLGGYLAPYCASLNNKISCVVGNSGFATLEGTKGANNLKALNKRGILYMTGCNNLKDAMLHFDMNITKAPRLKIPLLYFHSGKDSVIANPKIHAKTVMNWADGEKELRYYSEAEHCTIDFLDEVMPYITDWLKKHLQ